MIEITQTSQIRGYVSETNLLEQGNQDLKRCDFGVQAVNKGSCKGRLTEKMAIRMPTPQSTASLMVSPSFRGKRMDSSEQ